jgi:aspartate/methionine/tyrosine aminotransferase
MINNTPIDFEIVTNKIENCGIPDLGRATIREMVKIVNDLENESGKQYIRMEMGVPGLAPTEIGINAEIKALHDGVASKYPMIDGVKELKIEFARFMKLFADIELDPQCCIPTVGSMQGGFAAFLLISKCRKNHDTTLFLDPGFPVQKQQHIALGIPYESFDVYNFRGKKLYDKLESYLQKGNISSIIYSSPNNPSWICFTEEELQIIAELATKYKVVVIEDLAYFAMDFRTDLSKPGEPPYQPTVARYTDFYVLLVSSSKAFSYAGERIGMMAISKKLFESIYPDLMTNFRTDRFGYALIYRAIYSLSSGTAHSVQFAFTAMLKAANEGIFDFVEHVREYGYRAKEMKRLFLKYGFNIVYDSDGDKPLADGFYFTIAYKGMTGGELLKELLYYGISAISLEITGSERTEGLRACVSQIGMDKMMLLEERLKCFMEHHS